LCRNADGDSDDQDGGEGAQAGWGGDGYGVEWTPPADTDLAELEAADGEEEGWRWKLEQRLAACRYERCQKVLYV